MIHPEAEAAVSHHDRSSCRANRGRVGLAAAGVVLVLAGAATAFYAPQAVKSARQKVASIMASSAEASQKRITVTGTRISMATGVECSKVRTDAGEEVGISYLAPTIKVGTRVRITGFMAYKPTCRGPVLNTEKVEVLS